MAGLFYAKKHIRFAGEYFRPGEVFEAADSPELRRLISLGAAERCGGEMAEPVQAEEATEPEEVRKDEEMPAITADIDVMAGITAPKAKTTRKRKA